MSEWLLGLGLLCVCAVVVFGRPILVFLGDLIAAATADPDDTEVD